MSAPGASVTHPARRLAETAKKKAAGILSATRGKHKRMICMRGGKLVFVASNVIEEQLEAFLVVKGLLTAEALASIREEARSAGVRPSMMLLHRGEVDPDVLYRAATDRVAVLFSSTLEWGDAVFTYSAGVPKLDGELTVEAPFAPLMYGHALDFPKAMPEVRERIGPPEMRILRTADAKTALSEIELSESAKAVLEFCDGFLTPAEIVSRVRGSSEAAWRAIHALLGVGALRPVSEGEVPKVAVGESVSRDEMLARLSRDDTDHYSVLGLTPQADTEEIREAYYYLARRYHPDRHRMGEMKDLLVGIEAFFTKVTEAYNTLTDSELREQYDEEITIHKQSAKTEPQVDTRDLARQNFARAMLLTKKKQFHDALKFFENALELDPSKAEYHLELGCVLSLNPRSREQAEKVLRQAIHINPALGRAYVALGEICERAERFEEALANFEEALRWEPRNSVALTAVERLGGGGRRKGLFGS